MSIRLFAATLAALFLGGCVHVDFGQSDRYTEDFHHVFPLQAGAHVSVESHNGSIDVVGWDKDEAEVSGTKSASSESLLASVKIDIHNTPTSLELRAVKPTLQMGSTGARFTLHVPHSALVDRLETSNAQVHVRDVAAAAHLKSSNGSIRVENVQGDVDARTSNSSIEVDGVGGEAQLHSTNGRISVDHVAKRLDAETSNSSIKARLDGNAPVRAGSSNGSIDLGFSAPPKADVRASTSNSSITVHLPANAAVRLEAGTSNSSVSSDFEVVGALNVDESRRKNHLNGVIGGGGPLVELTSSNGHIRIAKGAGID